MCGYRSWLNHTSPGSNQVKSVNDWPLSGVLMLLRCHIRRRTLICETVDPQRNVNTAIWVQGHS